MLGVQRFFSEKNVHVAFEVSLLFKGAFALVEIATGVLAYFATQKFLLDMAQRVTQAELTEDPNDFVANHLLHAAQGLSVNSQHFTAFYLLSHGLIKVWLIAGLWRKRLWYYPVTIAIFGALIVYQLYRYTFAPSLLLLLITALDAIVVGLTWFEYQHLRRIL